MCNPPVPEGCLTKVIVVPLTSVILYSCPPASPKLIISPFRKPVPEVKVIVVSPIAVDESLVVVFAVSSYAVALGQLETLKLLPHVPAVLAAHSPTLADPLLNAVSYTHLRAHET